METYFNTEAATLALLLGAGLICLVFAVGRILCLVLAIVEDANVRDIDYGDDWKWHDRKQGKR